MLVEVESLPGIDTLRDRTAEIPVISTEFLKEMRQIPHVAERLKRIQAMADRRQAAREAACEAASIVGRAAALAANVCTIAIHGDGIAATREVVRQVYPNVSD